jgi:hypothetical protein
MNSRTVGLFICCAVPLGAPQAEAQDLNPALRVFEPFLNQAWVGRFDDPEETMETHVTFEVLLRGAAIRQSRSVPAANFNAETLYYWDPEAESIAYIVITDNGYLTQGFITPTDSGFVKAGMQYGPGSAAPRETRSQTVLNQDGTFVEGPLGSGGGHTIIFESLSSHPGRIAPSISPRQIHHRQ